MKYIKFKNSEEDKECLRHPQDSLEVFQNIENKYTYWLFYSKNEDIACIQIASPHDIEKEKVDTQEVAKKTYDDFLAYLEANSIYNPGSWKLEEIKC